MLKIEKQKTQIEHGKLQIEVERLKKDKRKKTLHAATAKPGTKLNTVKLPKLDFSKFSGELLKWLEFWDSFDSAVPPMNHRAQ